MALQLSTVRTSFERLKKDISDVSNATFIEWCNFANRIAYRYLIGVDSGRFPSTNTYSSVTSGSQALPADFHDIQASGMGVYLTDADGNPTITRLPRTGYGSSSYGYYIEKGNIVFTGVESAETFIMRYIPSLTAFTDLSDFFTINGLTGGVETIPEEYLQVLVNDIDRLYSQWDEVAGEESLADFRFARLLDEMARTIRKEPDTYQVPDLSIAF